MGLIGFTTGLIGFLLHQLIEKIADVKWDLTQKYLEVCMFMPKDTCHTDLLKYFSLTTFRSFVITPSAHILHLAEILYQYALHKYVSNNVVIFQKSEFLISMWEWN